jgi:biotin synthase
MNISFSELEKLYKLPFFTLLEKAHEVHRTQSVDDAIQLCGALSIKTGRCPEDCAFCPQSAHYKTNVTAEALLPIDQVVEAVRKGMDLGVSHFCLGAAWGIVPEGKSFEYVLKLVAHVHKLNVQVCCSLGSISDNQAQRLLEAGCSIYNYNLDTSPKFYPKVITTRSFEFRYQTLKRIQTSGLKISCGGILGMGETVSDRLKLIHIISQLSPQPEMVPLNILVPIQGTPLEHQIPIDPFEYVRIVALTRMLMPKTVIAMAGGRHQLLHEAQALAFYAGVNAIYIGERILVTPTPDANQDLAMLKKLSIVG